MVGGIVKKKKSREALNVFLNHFETEKHSCIYSLTDYSFLNIFLTFYSSINKLFSSQVELILYQL